MFLWQSLLNILAMLLTQKDYVQLKAILEAPAPKDLNQMQSTGVCGHIFCGQKVCNPKN